MISPQRHQERLLNALLKSRYPMSSEYLSSTSIVILLKKEMNLVWDNLNLENLFNALVIKASL